MIIGIAATYIELQVQAAACDIFDKCRCIAQNLRKDITVDKLLDLIDHEHTRVIGILQWIDTLTQNIPELSIYKSEVSLRY